MMSIVGYITLANGKVVSATLYADGTATWSQTKMIRHGSGTAEQGAVQRKASAKQIATFVADIQYIQEAEIFAHAQETEIAENAAILAEALVMRAEREAYGEAALREADSIVAAVESAEKVVNALLTAIPPVDNNFLFMAKNAMSVSARWFWARKAGLDAVQVSDLVIEQVAAF